MTLPAKQVEQILGTQVVEFTCFPLSASSSSSSSSSSSTSSPPAPSPPLVATLLRSFSHLPLVADGHIAYIGGVTSLPQVILSHCPGSSSRSTKSGGQTKGEDEDAAAAVRIGGVEGEGRTAAAAAA
eukprot:CAMPEP_0175100848 /NCGR_PEP_ID=MMETSP0086_2-20121207/7383_1 /TAXON_ID=136419 /ORGANISM="Unknown Unknown, Strain D1" /LENGTH=126 /DNA_ID=CAMNT_0016375141 /DNA_START=39 /DNA_END=415 /DNA_ORIENTATION=+